MKFFKIAGIEMIFIILLILTTAGYTRTLSHTFGSYAYLNPIIEKTQLGLSSLTGQEQHALIQADKDLKMMYVKMALLTLAFLAVVMLLIGFIKSKQWEIIQGKRWRRKEWLKLSLLLLVWCGSLAISIVLLTYTVKSPLNTWIIVTETIIFVYLSIFLYPIFAKEKKIFKAIKQTLMLSQKKIIIPFILMFIVYYLITAILTISLINIPLFIILFLISYSAYFTWIKLYANKVIR